MTRKPSVILPAVAVVLLLGLYVLSVGPASQWFLAHESWIDTVSAFYVPLDWLANHSEIANRVLSEYVDWWLVSRRGPSAWSSRSPSRS